MRLQEILNETNRAFFFIESSQNAEEAISLLSEKHLSALIVTEDDRPVGIFTERDVVLAYIRCDKRPFNQILLKDAMTNKLIVGKSDDDVEKTIGLMVQADIRHLPIFEGREIVGVIYICDLLHHYLGSLSTELRYLEDYLADLHDAGKD
ncbi:MAG: CBS domain-containing protein [Desulfatiglandaceae bacterium]|jgi:CBS domain-containing protein